MRLPLHSRAAAALVAALLLCATAASADWLVMRDGGSPVETAGPWKVDGRMVVFESPEGNLSSLQLSLVDLEASERMTAERRARAEERARKEKQPPEERRRRPSVARITDADLPSPPTEAEAEPPAEEGVEAPPEGDEAVVSPDGVEMAGWEHGYDENGTLWVQGDVLNPQDGVTAIRIVLQVRVYDQDGSLIAEKRAPLTPSALAPGETASFDVAFPEVYHFGFLKFDLTSGGLRTAPRGGEGTGGGPTAE